MVYIHQNKGAWIVPSLLDFNKSIIYPRKAWSGQVVQGHSGEILSGKSQARGTTVVK